jgi:hypothetical protein
MTNRVCAIDLGTMTPDGGAASFGGLGLGGVIGIAIGCVVVCIVCIIIAVVIVRKRFDTTLRYRDVEPVPASYRTSTFSTAGPTQMQQMQMQQQQQMQMQQQQQMQMQQQQQMMRMQQMQMQQQQQQQQMMMMNASQRPSQGGPTYSFDNNQPGATAAMPPPVYGRPADSQTSLLTANTGDRSTYQGLTLTENVPQERRAW